MLVSLGQHCGTNQVPPMILASQMSASLRPRALLLSSSLEVYLEKPGEDHSNSWAPATHMGNPTAVSGF